MARTFNGDVANVLRASSAVITGSPLTLSVWAKANAIGNHMGIWFIGNGGSNTQLFGLEITAAGKVGCFVVNGGTTESATTANIVTAGAWFHALITVGSSTSRKAYLNGDLANAGSDTDLLADPTGLDRTSFGSRDRSSPVFPFDGVIGEAAAWTADLSVNENDIVTLSEAVDPELMRPSDLVEVWRMDQAAGASEIGTQGALELAVVGSVGAADTLLKLDRMAGTAARPAAGTRASA